MLRSPVQGPEETISNDSCCAYISGTQRDTENANMDPSTNGPVSKSRSMIPEKDWEGSETMEGHTSELIKHRKQQLSLGYREVPSGEEDPDQEESRCTEESQSSEGSESKVVTWSTFVGQVNSDQTEATLCEADSGHQKVFVH